MAAAAYDIGIGVYSRAVGVHTADDLAKHLRQLRHVRAEREAFRMYRGADIYDVQAVVAAVEIVQHFVCAGECNVRFAVLNRVKTLLLGVEMKYLRAGIYLGNVL